MQYYTGYQPDPGMMQSMAGLPGAQEKWAKRKKNPAPEEETLGPSVPPALSKWNVKYGVGAPHNPNPGLSPLQQAGFSSQMRGGGY